MRVSVLLATALISCAGMVGNARALNCSLESYGNPTAAASVLDIAEGRIFTSGTPTKLRLWASATECPGSRTNICLKAVTQYNVTPIQTCTTAIYACPSIVREVNLPCRRIPTIAGEKTSTIGARRLTFRATVRPVGLNNRKEQTQVTFQAVASCGEGTFKSNVAATNVTCERGLRMDQFMRQLRRKLR